MRRSLSLLIMITLGGLLLAGCNASNPNRVSAGPGWQPCESERPKVCTMIYDPVCGQQEDGARADYASPCNACADITVTAWHPETCED